MSTVQAPIRYLTRAQAAELLQCSPRTIDRYIRDGVLPRIVINRHVRIEERAIHQMMAAHASK